MDEIKIENIKPQLVAGIRCRGSYNEIIEIMPKLLEHLASNNIELTGPPIYIFHEETPEEALEADINGTADIEVCAPISQRIGDTEEIRCYMLAGGDMVKRVHEGSYSKYRPFHQQLYNWGREHNKRITAPFREYYLNDPHRVHENEILTEIYAPVN